MKVQVFVILSLVAVAAAVPNFRSRRATNDSTTEAPAVDCGSGSAGGVGGLLSQVSNLLVNLLTNIENIKINVAGQDLVNLKNLLNQVSNLLTTLLGDTGESDSEAATNTGLLSSTIGQITNLLDNLLGPGEGSKYACKKSGGIVGRLVQRILDSVSRLLTGATGNDLRVLKPIVKLLLGVVASLLAVLV